MSNTWTDKYKAQTIKDITVNKNKVQQLKKIIQSINSEHSTSKPNIIISGDHGIGKNASVSLILNEFNYTYDDNIIHMLKNKYSLSEILENHFGYIKMIKTLENPSAKIALVINDIESITLKTEKKNLIALCKYNVKNKLMPIIFIIDAQHNKYVNELKKISTLIVYDVPKFEEMKEICNKICVAEGIKFSEEKIQNSMILYAQNDIRRLINTLQDLYITYPNMIIDIDCYRRYINHTNKKDVEIKLFEATTTLLNEYKTMKTIDDLYTEEKVLLPLMMNENNTRNIFSRFSLIKKPLNEQKKQLEQILNVSRTISDYNSKADVVETNIYTDQSWINQSIYGFYTLGIGSFMLNTNMPKQITTHEISFNADLNKTSLRKINKKKNILPVQEFTGLTSISEILYLNKFFKHLIGDKDNGGIEKAQEYCNNISTNGDKYLDMILKIDKTTL